jgi:hypothetical protein
MWYNDIEKDVIPAAGVSSSRWRAAGGWRARRAHQEDCVADEADGEELVDVDLGELRAYAEAKIIWTCGESRLSRIKRHTSECIEGRWQGAVEVERPRLICPRVTQISASKQGRGGGAKDVHRYRVYHRSSMTLL